MLVFVYLVHDLDVGYCVVLGLGLWAGNVLADIRVVNTTNTDTNQAYVSVYCPGGYVMVACTGTLPGYDYFGNEAPTVISPRLNSNNNPTSCHAGPFGTGGGQTLRAFCAKVCN